VYILRKAFCHSSGCKALSTNIAITMSTDPGVTPSGNAEPGGDERSQIDAFIVPIVLGEVKRGFDYGYLALKPGSMRVTIHLL
jgi:hypothetical protein